MPVPILLVTGFLGAGKTTVVNHLLAHAEGRRIAAVVNDFGAINIDAELIAGASDGVVSLANGCICCSLEGDLLRTLSTLLRRDPKPEYIVIETSGVADPADIVRNLMDPVILREARLETVLCVMDATAPPSALDDALQRSQLRVADIVALSKLDLADADAGARMRAAIRALRIPAVVVDAQHGEIPAALLWPAATGRGALRDAELDLGQAGLAAPLAAGHQPTGAEAGARQGIVREHRAARTPDGVSVRRRSRHARTGRCACSGRGTDADRLHRRAWGALEEGARRHHGGVRCGQLARSAAIAHVSAQIGRPLNPRPAAHPRAHTNPHGRSSAHAGRVSRPASRRTRRHG
jgi:G3E family GTPase